MGYNRKKVRLVVKEDRLSSLPDELIHKILSSFDMKFVVQTCLLSSRWKLFWTSMPCLNFSSEQFNDDVIKFAKFMIGVLSHRNHQMQVSSVKLEFRTEVSQVIVGEIANYAFSHNAQELTVSSWPGQVTEYPLCLFSSHSLIHFTLSSGPFYFSPCVTPKTPWDFPALTTLHLSNIELRHNTFQESVDLFSKCVNLKKLTLEHFSVPNVKAFDIITPRLSTLVLNNVKCLVVINLIAPHLEKLTIINCLIEYLNAPPGLSSLYYGGHRPLQLSKDRFHSLNKVTIFLYFAGVLYAKEDARKTIIMLQEIHSVRYLTLNVDIVEGISSFPDLLLHHPSRFSNLNCLCIVPRLRKDSCQATMSNEARNFFLENSPNATLIMDKVEGC